MIAAFYGPAYSGLGVQVATLFGERRNHARRHAAQNE